VMIVLGLDPSSTATGWFLGERDEGGNWRRVNSGVLKPIAKNVGAWWATMKRRGPIDLVAYEDVILVWWRSAKAVGKVIGRFEQVCSDRNKAMPVNIKAIHSRLGGEGWKGDRVGIRYCVAQILGPDDSSKLGTDDEFDAAAVAIVAGDEKAMREKVDGLAD
jgi:Holliday junction resolvasome RuvABC endonuclease subunit